ncbi:MAG: hypothetical protein CME62_06095 [Halobacteriovoraceae bacterium]|nr:hypothetical protein [Halobacteriovoraceae bacterium]|tara:strand:+ start:27534 stop:28508 length:975 start_codon:yes stop_codon:yes gene_type:complete
MKLKDVYIPLDQSNLKPYLEKLQYELDLKGLEKFKPYFWFSDEWFTPDGHTGIAIPFYLAHKKLAKIQEKLIYDVEGGTPTTFMKLLRHECGHAIDNAFQLRRRRKRQQVFGKSSLKYEETYAPKPFSKQYVTHLNGWYSQSHPDEDFAETFAVWLNPRSAWRKKYKNWKGAYKKLLFMDELMSELQHQKPLLSTRKQIDPQSKMTTTLQEHYDDKREHYGIDYPSEFDVHLLKLFTNNPDVALNIKASRFIREIKKDVRKSVSPWTGAYQYTINEILQEVIKRCDELNLKLKLPFDESKNQFIAMLSIVTIEYIHNGSHRIAR